MLEHLEILVVRTPFTVTALTVDKETVDGKASYFVCGVVKSDQTK